VCCSVCVVGCKLPFSELIWCFGRRQGLAKGLMDLLEEVTHKVHDGYFVDLFVRQSNVNAINMYNKVCCPCAKTLQVSGSSSARRWSVSHVTSECHN
jgi:hypothetical protein